jgi:glycerol-3-phosphate dehydrogenase
MEGGVVPNLFRLVNWTHRDHARRLAEVGKVDVMVIGGGVIGSGVALDLQTRGLDVALVEQSDFGAGTSSRSTKLFHGGIRYLPQFRFHLVSEGLREQRVLARVADYLFEPLEFVVPVYDQFGLADAPEWAATGRRASFILGAGLTLYDLLGGVGRPGERNRRLSKQAVLEAAPRLRSQGLRGGFAYSDAQTDDARLVIALARTAADHGAIAVSRSRATSVRAVGDGFQVTVGERTVGARAVVAATGAFPPPDSSSSPMLLSKGAHVIVAMDQVGLGARAIVLPKTDDGRVLFIIPWAGHALIGTTDTAYSGSLFHPIVDGEDVKYLLEHVTRYLDVGPITAISSFAGLRSLADTAAETTASASREHLIREPEPGYFQIAGGKLTTYRRIAADVAKRVSRRLSHKAKGRTKHLPLAGAGGGRRPDDRLHARYGTRATEVRGVLSQTTEGHRLLSDDRTYLGEARYAVEHEAAVSLADFTMRRTRLALLSAGHSRRDAEAIAKVMAEGLDWSDTELVRQIELHEEELTAEGL